MRYIASFSGGKDSTATIILAHEHGEPLDQIVFCEVMYSEDISGELPEHISFIRERCIPLFKEWGYETTVLHADQTYLDIFFHAIERTKKEERKGKRAGFPMAGRCAINRSLKINPIHKFYKGQDLDAITQYIGIAVDEPKRLERLKEGRPAKISLLERYGYTEAMAFDLCRKYGLLSPIYDFAPRGGCWFCPNCRIPELKHLRKHHKDLWDRLVSLEREPDLVGRIWNTLKNVSVTELEDSFYWEEQQMGWDDLKQECFQTGEPDNGR